MRGVNQRGRAKPSCIDTVLFFLVAQPVVFYALSTSLDCDACAVCKVHVWYSGQYMYCFAALLLKDCITRHNYARVVLLDGLGA